MSYMFTLVTTMNITIRGINQDYWRALKIEAVREGLTVGQALNLALEKWISEFKHKKETKKKKSFWDLEPFLYQNKDAVLLSTKIDEVLYGENQ